MTYLLLLPRQGEIRQLARQITRFPTTADHIIRIAKQYDYSDDLVYFLRQFYEGKQPEVFESREDFFNRATDLAMLIREERKQPTEVLLSPQG